MNASIVSKKLATRFNRENVSTPGHVKGWGNINPGFKVTKKNQGVIVEWIEYSISDEMHENRIEAMAQFLQLENFVVEKDETWRGSFLIVRNAN